MLAVQTHSNSYIITSLKVPTLEQDLHQDTDDAAICAAILAMSQQLGLTVVAEGVETREQLEFLRRYKCDHIQGYICSKPMPADDFFALLLKLSGQAANSDKHKKASA